jgi:hypothetical protein
MLPGWPWCVHDPRRPQPRVVTPGRNAAAPSDAVVLFDGSSLAGWETLEGKPAGWKLVDGCMEVVPSTGNIRTRAEFGDCQLHLEFASPAVIEGDSQGRGNSGVFIMGRYEIQVLDGYQNPTYADGMTGAIYGQYPPLVNACLPPGQWQTYDIIWVGPRFDGDKLVSPARLTLLHNGVLLHHDQPLMSPTTHKRLASYEPHPTLGPLMLQDHRNPVRFRNIWYRPLKGYDE